MATIFSTNMNVFTADPVTPLHNEVISWGWRDETQTEFAQRAKLERDSAHALRWFKEATEVASAYIDGKVLLSRQGRFAHARAVCWVNRAARRSDAVLLGAPMRGRDRLLWTAAYVTARLTKRPIYVYSEVWLEPEGWRNWTTRLIQRALRRNAACILVPSRGHRAFNLRRGVPPERIVEIPSIYCPKPATRRLLEQSRVTTTRMPTILYVGRLVRLKALDRLLEITDRIASSGKAFQLLVVITRSDQYTGRNFAYTRRCHELLAQQPHGRAEVIQHCEGLEKLFERVDFLVMPHVVLSEERVPAESWGRVVEEALFHGVPVISTDAVPAANELIEEGINGWIVPWDSDLALEQAISDRLDALVSGRVGESSIKRESGSIR